MPEMAQFLGGVPFPPCGGQGAVAGWEGGPPPLQEYTAQRTRLNWCPGNLLGDGGQQTPNPLWWVGPQFFL